MLFTHTGKNDVLSQMIYCCLNCTTELDTCGFRRLNTCYCDFKVIMFGKEKKSEMVPWSTEVMK